MEMDKFSIADIVKYFQPGKSVRFCLEEAFGKVMRPADGGIVNLANKYSDIVRAKEV
ncbi:MAG: hypothetical protein IEMM0007_0489 [bacterium]|nr:MAG: hypothetical protein IEMM0007_0489 [bacterium]